MQYWSRFNVLQSLSMYAEAYPEHYDNITSVMVSYMLQAMERMETLPFGDSWSGARWQDFELSILWLFDHNATMVGERDGVFGLVSSFFLY